MQWYSFFVLCTLLFIVVTAKPSNKHPHKKTHSNRHRIKSNTDAFKFLNRFGYDPCQNRDNSVSNDDDDLLCHVSMESMLESFQIKFHLPVTKKLDTTTLKLMNTPRCGLPDSPPSVTDRSKLWPKDHTLRWKLSHGYEHLSFGLKKSREYIQQAFNDWANDAQLTFREASKHENADFNLSFANGEHGDGEPFDGPGGTLAHAFFPWVDDHRGDIHFDSTEQWSDTYDGVGINLRLVAAHEIGHSLGLRHSYEPNALMNPFYQLIQPKNMLPSADRKNIRFIYKTDSTSSTNTPTAPTKTVTRPTSKKGQASWIQIAKHGAAIGDDCLYLTHGPSAPVSECLAKCDQIAGCSAINFRPSDQDCVLRNCANFPPVVITTDVNADYQVYARSSIAATKQFDPNSYYRLTSHWQGDGKSLDIVNDGKNNNQPILSQTGDYSGQQWKIMSIDNGYYRISNYWQGDDKSLGIVNNGKNDNRLILAPTGTHSSQRWKITPIDDVYYRISNYWKGVNKSIDIINDGKKNNQPILKRTGAYSGQHWKITKL